MTVQVQSGGLARRSLAAARTIAQSCLGWRVRMMNRLVTAHYDDALRPLGLTGAQLSILCALQLSPRRRPVDIGNILKIDKSTLSRNLERMARNGWISKAARRGELGITPQGLRLVAEALPRWKKAQAEVEELLGVKGSGVVAAIAMNLAGGRARAATAADML
jgi:DNA-binding MarR family transcriptional regulator